MSDADWDAQLDQWDAMLDWEDALSECGLNGSTNDEDICLEAGTEHCMFWCPFNEKTRPKGQKD